jgi:hypothetical protein
VSNCSAPWDMAAGSVAALSGLTFEVQ